MSCMDYYGGYDVERGIQGEQFWEAEGCEERWVDSEFDRGFDRDLRGRRCCGYWCWRWCCGGWRWCWCSVSCRCCGRCCRCCFR